MPNACVSAGKNGVSENRQVEERVKYRWMRTCRYAQRKFFSFLEEVHFLCTAPFFSVPLLLVCSPLWDRTISHRNRVAVHDIVAPPLESSPLLRMQREQESSSYLPLTQ